jgi:crotonobetainyl-CoA:carnitine CoA-transferase CaiB-like acyl-CoA transferase
VLRSAGSGVDARPAPRLGEHTDEVLVRLGLGDEDRSRLRASGVIGGDTVGAGVPA